MRPVPKPVKQPKKKRKPVKSSKKRGRIIKEIDSIDSDICLLKSKMKCLLCGKRANQTHHFFPKASHGNVRFTELNHCPMCFTCHKYRVHMAGEVEELRDKLIKKIGEESFELLKREAYIVSDYSEKDLKDILLLKQHYYIAVVDGNKSVHRLSAAAKKRLEKIKKDLTNCSL